MTPLRPDSACCRQLNWRSDLPVSIDAVALETLLSERGWTHRCRYPALKVLRHAQGHEAAWVVASGRLQLRVHVTVEESQRRARATELYEGFQDCLAQLMENP